MDIQNLGVRLADFGRAVEESVNRAAAKLDGLVVKAGEALSRVGSAIREFFSAIGTAFSARLVDIGEPPPMRRGAILEQGLEGGKGAAGGETILGGGEKPGVSPPPSTGLETKGTDTVRESSGAVPSTAPTKTGGSEETPKTAPMGFAERIDTLASVPRQIGGKEVPPMAKGDTAVSLSGLVPKHVDEFKKVAAETNTILMFRPVNPMSTGLLAEGTSAKGLNVHGKSSDWGPMAGYIAVDQNLSKKHSDEGAITRGNHDNHHSLEHDGKRVASLPLKLTGDRLQYLLGEKLLTPSDETGKPIEDGKANLREISYFVNGGAGKGNDHYLFRLVPGEDGLSVEYRSREGKDPTVGDPVADWTPLQVMGDAKQSKPLTADYDVFATLPKMDEGKLLGKSLEESRFDGLMRQIRELKDELKGLDPNSEEGKTAKTQLSQLRRQFITKAMVAKRDETKIESLKTKIAELGEQIKGAGKEEAERLGEQKTELTQQLFALTVKRAKEMLLGQAERKDLDPDLGRLAGWQRDLRDKMNEGARKAGFDGGDVVKHGTEQDNTQFPEKDEQIFIIMPGGETYLTQSWEQTQAFFWAAKQDDYLAYQNRAYNPAQNEELLRSRLGDGFTEGNRVYYPGQDRGGPVGPAKFDFDPLGSAKQFGLVS